MYVSSRIMIHDILNFYMTMATTMFVLLNPENGNVSLDHLGPAERATGGVAGIKPLKDICQLSKTLVVDLADLVQAPRMEPIFASSAGLLGQTTVDGADHAVKQLVYSLYDIASTYE
jgi:hypothetical protein